MTEDAKQPKYQIDQDLPIDLVEANLLSIILNTSSQDLLFKASEKITAEYFSNSFHSTVYKHIYNMVLIDSSPIDKALIASKIRKVALRRQFDKLVAEKPPVENFEAYLTALEKDYKVRRFKEIIFERSAAFYDDREINVEEEIDKLENEILGMVTTNKQIYSTMGDLVPDVLKSIRDKKFVAELEFPLPTVNEMLYGLQPVYYVIAARPSVGKSMLALDIALHNAEMGHKGIIFSLEMPKDSIIRRAIAREARVPHFRIRKGDLEDEEIQIIESAGKKIMEYPLLIDDTAGITANEIMARTKRAMIRHPDIKYVIVDYMQIVATTGNNGGNREQEVTKISNTLKTISKNFNLPVIVISQLSREVEKRPDKRPILADLRSSGSIEQDADVIMFLYSDNYYNNKSANVWTTEVLIAKHRNGQTGTVLSYALHDYQMFTESGTSGDVDF